MATLSNKTLAALTLAALTIGMAQPAYAATTSPSTKTQTTSTNTTGSGTQAQQYFSPDGLRSIQTSRGSLQLQTLDGEAYEPVPCHFPGKSSAFGHASTFGDC